MRRSTLLALAFQGLLVSPSIADDRICRFPSGTATDDVPCTSDDNTFCCAPGSICMDNGYCYSLTVQPFMLSRGTCTDRNWGKSCPQLCTGDNNDLDRGSVIVFLEDGDGDNSSRYCCDALEWNSDDNVMGCVSGADPITLEAGKAMIGAAALQGLTLIDKDDYNADGINVSQINGTTDSNGNGTTTTGSSPTPTACVNATTPPGTSDSSDNDNSGKETAIGAGVGVPLGVIALASLVWAFWLQKQNRELKKAAQAQGQFQGQMGYGGQPGMMMSSSGYMSHGPVNSGHHGHFVELGEMEGGPTELSATAKHGP